MNDPISKSAIRVGKILVDLENLAHYANFTEKSLRGEMEEINAFIREHGRQPSIDDELWNVSEVFPHLHRSAALLSIFAFFDHNLNAVCDALAEEHGKRLRVVDIHGRGLARAKIYLSKEIGIAFPGTSEAWQELAQLNDLRNAIAHRDGLLRPEDKGLRNYIAKSQYVTIDKVDNRVRLQEGILKLLLGNLEVFFRDLGDAICE